MHFFFILLGIFAVASAFQEIDELSDMVTDRATSYQLKMLAKDSVTPREQIVQGVKVIVENQSAEIQEVYKMFLDAHDMKEKAEYKKQLIVFQNMGAPQKIIDAYKKIYDIERDMSLSRREVKNQVKAVENELKSQLTAKERRYLESFSSEEFF